MGAFQMAVGMQHHRSGMAHDAGIWLADQFDVMPGVNERVD
jgi:hypothetical protein